MKSLSPFINELKHMFKKKNRNINQSSILKNIKIQNIYSSDKINKNEHYIYFKEHDIKTRDNSYANDGKTKKMFNSGLIYYKHSILFTMISSVVGIILFVVFFSSKINDYYD
ncbi:conserved protein, unknown function [Hepatocystis sp. ex Piliocolobus tephrosceles]|nr:conserved protein, unknown function [Hepatocystis sp. ex Piliocolobus tephrosceles]